MGRKAELANEINQIQVGVKNFQQKDILS